MTDLFENPRRSEWVDECYRKWFDTLLRYAWSITRDWNVAQDAVQIAFASLAQSKIEIPKEATKAWLYKVTFRNSIRLREERKKNLALEDADESQMHPSSKTTSLSNPLSVMVANEDSYRMKEAIQHLPEEQRLVLEKRIFENLTFAEVASQLQIPLGTALSRMRLALERLRNAITHDDNH